MSGIQVYQLPDPLGRAIGNARDDHATIAVTDQDDLAQVLERHHVDHIGDVHLKVDLWAEQMPSLADSGQCRAVDFVAGLTQEPCHLLVAPTTVMPAVYEYKGRHGRKCAPAAAM